MNIVGKRTPGTLIIDEEDNVILDNAAHMAKLSDPISEMEYIIQLHETFLKDLFSLKIS